jgi:GMP synthase (glutamine-hydrolysing)
LGICYGHQLLAQLLNAKVAPGRAEYGRSTLKITHPNSLFRDIPDDQTVWMSHGDSVLELPEHVDALAATDSCEIAAFADLERSLYGVQFHPEVAHTTHGVQVLRNFSQQICGISADQSLKSQVDHIVENIREKVGDRSVFFFVSGGVDSTVAFALCAKALPRDRVIGVYVDTGLMRKNETEELQILMDSAGLGDRLRIRYESDRFLRALNGVVDPETKRHIIGREFVRVQEDAMQELAINGNEWLLGQGTIYPDTVESGGTNSATALIKTHHNRCDEIRELIDQGKVIEPLSELYKDQVRRVGREIGLSELLTERWPFPGPGLAIRCLCIEKSAETELRPADNLPPLAHGYTATHFPIRSVGVQGDFRTYREVVALSGPSEDYDRLSLISASLCNASKLYNRVVLHLAGKTSNGRVVAKSLTKDRLDLLREADHIVSHVMREDGLVDSVWQFPTVLIPVSFSGGETIVLRPINSQDGMTANFARVRATTLRRIAAEICQLKGIDAVFLDVTDKPPATIEWE